MSAVREDDWWDALYEGEPTKAATEPAADPDGPDTVSVAVRLGRTRPPQLRPADHITALARHALPSGIRVQRLGWLAYNGGAALAGWKLGVVPWAAGRIAYYGNGDTPRGVWLGIALVLACSVLEIRTHPLRDRSRHPWVRLAGWVTRIPVASAVLALALYSAPL